MKSEIKRYKKLLGDNEEKLKLINQDIENRIQSSDKLKYKL